MHRLRSRSDDAQADRTLRLRYMMMGVPPLLVVVHERAGEHYNETHGAIRSVRGDYHMAREGPVSSRAQQHHNTRSSRVVGQVAELGLQHHPYGRRHTLLHCRATLESALLNASVDAAAAPRFELPSGRVRHARPGREQYRRGSKASQVFVVVVGTVNDAVVEVVDDAGIAILAYTKYSFPS